MHFWYICIVLGIFNVISEEFKFSKVFWMRSTFNALILQSLIFLIESTLVLFVFKINTKYKKKKSWGTNMIVTKPHFSYKYQSTVEKKREEKILVGRWRKFWGAKEHKKTLRDWSFHLFQTKPPHTLPSFSPTATPFHSLHTVPPSSSPLSTNKYILTQEHFTLPGILKVNLPPIHKLIALRIIGQILITWLQ